ncbi:MAG: hypothetical protein VB035_03730 [Candidatus Fimivivens sp.]|nr:hypothetical protein [Candidatus Fimivivens sp.]
MKTSRITRAFSQALFPAIMTVVSLVLFIAIYGLELLTAIEPQYLKNLIFVLPAVCFAIVTYLTQKRWLKELPSLIITSVLIGVLSCVMFIAFIISAFDAATTTTTDVKRYERALQLSSFSEDVLESYFPEKVPENAEEVYFYYRPAFLQGGEDLALKFKTTPEALEGYAQKFSEMAEWVGKEGDPKADEHGVFGGTVDFFDRSYNWHYNATVYVLSSRSYKPDDWNHGERYLVAIKEKNCEVLFLASRW